MGILAETTPLLSCPILTLRQKGLATWTPVLSQARLSGHSTRGKVLGELAPRKGARWDTPRSPPRGLRPDRAWIWPGLAWAEIGVRVRAGVSLLGDTPARPRVRGQANWVPQGLAKKVKRAREAPRARGPARPRPARPRPSDRDAPANPGYPNPGLILGGNMRSRPIPTGLFGVQAWPPPPRCSYAQRPHPRGQRGEPSRGRASPGGGWAHTGYRRARRSAARV